MLSLANRCQTGFHGIKPMVDYFTPVSLQSGRPKGE